MDDGPSSIPSAAYLVTLLVTAIGYLFFIAASLAISRARSTKITDLAQQRRSGAQDAIAILAHSEAYLVCAQVGRFVCVLSAGIVISELFEHLPNLVLLIAATFGQTSLPQWAGVSANITLVSVFVPATLIAVQIVKPLTLQNPETALCMVAGPLKTFFRCFGPLVLFVHSSVRALLSSFGLKTTHERDLAVSSDDLSELVRRSSQEGVIQKAEQELIEGVVELSDTIVREVMTPRADIISIKLGTTLQAFIQIVKREGVSRILVTGSDLDDVKGMVIIKDLIGILDNSSSTSSWEPYIREVQFVPNTKSVSDLLLEFREKRVHFAVVLDEHGGVDGVVTLEDLVEEIVGDISDEYDAPGKVGRPVIQFDGAIILDGSLSLVDLEMHHRISLPEGDYDTVAGFVLSELGHLPSVGESFRFEDLEIKVRDVQNNRVVRVSIQRPNPNRSKQDLALDGAPAQNSLPLAVDSD